MYGGLSYVAENGNGRGMVSVNCKVFRKGVWFPFSCCIVKPSTLRCTVTGPCANIRLHSQQVAFLRERAARRIRLSCHTALRV